MWLRKYKVRLLSLWQNKLFRQNEKKFHAKVLKSKDTNYVSPDLTALKLFWRKIFETPAKASFNSSWLHDLQGKLADKSFVVEEPNIDYACFDGCLSGLRN